MDNKGVLDSTFYVGSGFTSTTPENLDIQQIGVSPNSVYVAGIYDKYNNTNYPNLIKLDNFFANIEHTMER